MKNLIVIRHGDYDETTEKLNESGRKQAQELANYIRKNFQDNLYLISSSAQRAIETTGILMSNCISERCHINGVEILEELLEETNKIQEQKIIEIHKSVLDRKDKAENLVLITHKPIVSSYSAYFAEKELGKKIIIGEVNEGRGIIINMDRKWSFVP